MTVEELHQTMLAVANAAPSLRAAGVRELTVGDVRFAMDPLVPTIPASAAPEPPQAVSIAEDPATYGLPPGAPVPGADWVDWNEHRKAAERRDRELGRPDPKRRARE